MKKKLIKTVGSFGLTMLGIGLSLVTDWISEKQMEKKIEKKVNEALAKQDEEES